MKALIDRFFEAFQRDPARLLIPRIPDLPRDMLAAETAPPPWAAWQVVPGRVSVQTWREWEEAHGVHLPESFQNFFLSRHTLSLDCGLLRLACSPSNSPFSDLEELLEWDVAEIRNRQIFPIGDETLRDAGPLCLDLRDRKAEPPVVYWDGNSETIPPPVFSSFPKLLECLAFALENDLNVLQDEALLEQYLALDPEGAGGTGRPYWREAAGLED